MLNAEKWNSSFKNSQPWGQWGLLLHIFSNVDGSLVSVKRDFILGPLSLGGYFGTASLQYDYLNTTGTVSSVTQAGRFSHLPFKAYFVFFSFLFSLLLFFFLSLVLPYSPGFSPLQHTAVKNKSVRADQAINTMSSEVGMLGLDSWGPSFLAVHPQTSHFTFL